MEVLVYPSLAEFSSIKDIVWDITFIEAFCIENFNALLSLK